MENVTVPAWSKVEVLASTNSLCGSGTWLVEGLRDKNVPQVLVAGAVVKPIQDRELVCIPVRMVNPSPVAVTVYKGMAVAVAERIQTVTLQRLNMVLWTIGWVEYRHGKVKCCTTVCRAVTTCQRRNVRNC